MAVLVESTKFQLDSAIPTGSWTLYFHSPDETKWTLNTFISLGVMKTWRDFWTVMDGLQIEHLSNGMFFMMRDPSPPLWESHHHIRGGCYSFRCQSTDAPDIYVNHIIAVMLDHLTDPANQINGLSISPKRGFNIIKAWNNNAATFHKPSDLNTTFSTIREGDIIYTPFVQKKM
jgi:hypothetical protein